VAQVSVLPEERLRAALLGGLDELAAIEHERWAHWQSYLHEQGTPLPDGSLVLPANLIARWKRQLSSPYASLSDDERESDREQVLRYLPVLLGILTRA
jgi:hypothetical protein